MPKVLVVGAGSVGQRHIRNLLALGADVAVYRYRREVPLPEGTSVVADLAAALASPLDAVVVANRTDLHLEIALQAARAGKALFVEKPLSNSLRGVAELDTVTRQQNLAVEIGFMLRFHPNLRWLKDYLATGAIGEIQWARAAVGQHLPDWRPGTDHRLSYSAQRATGGGVIFDLGHELDLVGWLLGAATEVSAMTRYVPGLGIETEAIAEITLRLQSGTLAHVHLDYVRPGYARTLEIVGSAGTIAWDYVAGIVTGASGAAPPETLHRVPESFERNEMFRAHMQHFIRRLADAALPAGAALVDGVAALRVALAAHRSAEERRSIDPADIEPQYVPARIAA